MLIGDLGIGKKLDRTPFDGQYRYVINWTLRKGIREDDKKV